MEMLFSCPRCTGGAHLASQNQLFGSLAENGRFLKKPLIWKCYFPALVPIWRPKKNYLGALTKMVEAAIWKYYFPVPAALVPIWRPKIGIWEPCRKWSIS